MIGAQAAAVRAIAAAGGPGELAKALTESGSPITSQAIQQWTRIPHKRARLVAKFSGVPLNELRPDIWQTPDDLSQEAKSA